MSVEHTHAHIPRLLIEPIGIEIRGFTLQNIKYDDF